MFTLSERCHIKKCIALICFLVLQVICPSTAFPQGDFAEVTVEQAKAHYVIEIIKHVIWPNEDQFQTFVVGIYGNDLLFKTAFENKNTNINIRGKSLLVETIEDINFSQNRYSLIYTQDR